MTVNLSKGQSVSLEKQGGGTLTKVVMGLGWDAVKKKGFLGIGGSKQQIDLDASCVLFDEQRQQVDAVWYRQLRSKDGSIVHTGDNLTGEGEGDDEQIVVDLPQVPANVKAMVFTVNSFSGQNFSQVENAYCRVVDQTTNQEIARYDLSAQGGHTAQIMLKVYRDDQGGWKAQAIGALANGQTFADILPAITAQL
ncbi:MAG: TerD family protein [Chloroflexaceae bacterium]|nr:TerD family protein [Chloroflexaceae bacterium]